MSHLDIWETPEPFEVSLQEAVNIIWVKLSQLEEGMGPLGTPTQDSWGTPGTPTQSTLKETPNLDTYTPGTPTLGNPSWRHPQGPHLGWTRAEP